MSNDTDKEVIVWSLTLRPWWMTIFIIRQWFLGANTSETHTKTQRGAETICRDLKSKVHARTSIKPVPHNLSSPNPCFAFLQQATTRRKVAYYYNFGSWFYPVVTIWPNNSFLIHMRLTWRSCTRRTDLVSGLSWNALKNRSSISSIESRRNRR